MTKTLAVSGAAAVAAPDEPPGRPPAGTAEEIPIPPANPDAPVRVDVALPRDLFDRLTDHDDAPRCRYDAATGRAEFVAEPTLSHESRAAAVGEFFVLVALALEDAGSPIGLQLARATRLLSADGAFEPDEELFLGAGKMEAAERIDGWLDVRKGHPVPDLVVEIDRSTDSSGKLAPYFRMGVREAWTWSRRSGAAILGRGRGDVRGVRPRERQRGAARRDAHCAGAIARNPFRRGPPVSPAQPGARGRTEDGGARRRGRGDRRTPNLTGDGGRR